jgi:hypothetical protein
MSVALPLTSGAQRETKHNTNAWFTWVGDVSVNPTWGVEWDATLRRSGPLEEWQQILIRGLVRYVIVPNVRVGAGVAYNESFPFGELPIDHRRPEWRIFEQVVLTHPAQRVQILHRYRNEQRWIGFTDESGSRDGYDWVRTNRFRYLARGTVPLGGSQTMVGGWYSTLSSELFINWGSTVRQNVFDQWRTQVLLGRRISNVVALEVGLLEQLSLKPNGRDLERNHTLLLLLNTTFRREAGQRPGR